MRKKRQSSWQCRLALLGPTSVKAACKTLVKLTPALYLSDTRQCKKNAEKKI